MQNVPVSVWGVATTVLFYRGSHGIKNKHVLNKNTCCRLAPFTHPCLTWLALRVPSASLWLAHCWWLRGNQTQTCTWHVWVLQTDDFLLEAHALAVTSVCPWNWTRFVKVNHPVSCPSLQLLVFVCEWTCWLIFNTCIYRLTQLTRHFLRGDIADLLWLTPLQGLSHLLG